jgi:hypothetical protein
LGSEVLSPDNLKESYKQIHASLHGFDPCQFWNCAYCEKVFDPAAQILNMVDKVLHVDHLGCDLGFSSVVIKEGHDLWQADKQWNRQILLFEKRRRSTDAADVSYDCGSSLFEHVPEEFNSLVLELQRLSHLCAHILTVGVLPCVLHLGVHHEDLEQSHVAIACRAIQCDQHALISANQVLEDVKNDHLVLEQLSWGLDQSNKRGDENRRFKADSHLFQEPLRSQEV